MLTFGQYVEADLSDYRSLAPILREEPDQTLHAMIEAVVQIEGPVHFETVLERLRGRYGISRAKQPTRAHVPRSMVRLAATGRVRVMG